MYRTGGALRLAKWIIRSTLEAIGLGWLLARLGYARRGTTPESIHDAVCRINAMPDRHAVIDPTKLNIESIT